MAAGNHRAALPLLNRALWDTARIRKRELRLTETATVYESLERAYAAMGMTKVAADARRMARGISDAAGREPSAGATQLLGRAKDAYAAAQFQEAVRVCRLGLLAHPTLVEGRLVLGMALMALSRFGESPSTK